MYFTIKNDDKISIGIDVAIALQLGYPQDVVRESMRAEAMKQVDQEHAHIMRTLTGDATIEERDTWASKAAAAKAYLADSATEEQKMLIELEAAGDDTLPSDLAARIVAKTIAFHRLIGMASAMKRRASYALSQAVSDDVPIEDVEQAVTDAFEQISTETAAEINLWKTSA